MSDKILMDKSDLVRIADTVRLKRGSSEQLSLDDIFDSLEDNLYLIVDEAGNELYGTFVNQQILTDATANDIRLGKTAVTESGLVEGTKDIPAYRTYSCRILVLPNESFSIPDLSSYDLYDYTELQCIIAKFNTTFNDSVSSDKIVLNNQVFATGSTVALSNVSKNSESKSIDLNILNNSEDMYVIHAFMFREEV